VFEDENTDGLVTTGTPIALQIDNVDQRSKDYSEIRERYRPGHADYTYDVKYGVRDYRGGGRSSARETAMRVAAGAIARKVVPGMRVRGALVRIGEIEIDRSRWDWSAVDANPFFCPDAETALRWEDYLDGIRKEGSSVGAVVEVIAEGVPPGLGAPVYGKLDGEVAAAMMSINAVKGVEIGNGFEAARIRGEDNADEMRARPRRPAHLPLQPCRRRARRNLHGPAGRLSIRREADLVHAVTHARRHPLRHGDRSHNQGPPRPLRRHPRRACGRGDARLGAGGPLLAA
jgi:chorismate synthase